MRYGPWLLACIGFLGVGTAAAQPPARPRVDALGDPVPGWGVATGRAPSDLAEGAAAQGAGTDCRGSVGAPGCRPRAGRPGRIPELVPLLRLRCDTNL